MTQLSKTLLTDIWKSKSRKWKESDDWISLLLAVFLLLQSLFLQPGFCYFQHYQIFQYSNHKTVILLSCLCTVLESINIIIITFVASFCDTRFWPIPIPVCISAFFSYNLWRPPHTDTDTDTIQYFQYMTVMSSEFCKQCKNMVGEHFDWYLASLYQFV